jgi:hypothetical protein
MSYDNPVVPEDEGPPEERLSSQSLKQSLQDLLTGLPFCLGIGGVLLQLFTFRR